MAKQRPSVPTGLKQALVDEAGGKCANPGCPAYRTHLHHIEKWAIYETHDEKHMIALCPTCHDAVHHGRLAFDEETLYRWKRIERSNAPTRDHVYVEPGESSVLALGTLGITGQQGVTVFDLGPTNKVSFHLVDNDVMLVNLAISTRDGEEILRVVDGHVRRAERRQVTYEKVPGRIRVTAPANEEFIPSWALYQLRQQEPDFAADGTLPVLDLEVMKPGAVRVQGLWSGAGEHVVAITEERLVFMKPGLREPVSFVGVGYEESGIVWGGTIDVALFGFEGGSPGAITAPKDTPWRPGRNDPCWCGSGKKYKRCHGA